MNKITEGTLIPISMVITLVGGIFWLSVMYAQGNTNAKAIEKLDSRVGSVEEKVIKQNEMVIERLSRIEEQLKKK